MLFIGGTGTISLASTRLLAERGVELTVLNRGLSGIRLPEGVGELRADVGTVKPSPRRCPGSSSTSSSTGSRTGRPESR